MSNYPTYLVHFGILGQKWGERRWQNEDGSLTPEGYEHYGYGSKKEHDDISKSGYKVDKYGYATKEKKSITYTFDADAKYKYGASLKEKIDTANKVEKGISVINKNLDKKVNQILKEEFSDWNIPAKHNIKLKNIHIFDSSTAEANYWQDGPNDPLGGHELTIEFDPKTGKYRTHSLNG